MNLRRASVFLAEAIVIALAVAFIIILILRPEILTQRAVVEIKESPAPALTQGSGNAQVVLSYSQAAEMAAPSVVNIYTTKLIEQQHSPFLNDPFFRRFFGDNLPESDKRLENSLGSGVIVSANGYVLTNNHVIAEADEIQVALRDGRRKAARVIGTDPETDLALLRVDLPNLPAITFGQSDGLRVGDVVLAIGNPFGVGQTVTMGIVSALRRNELGLSTFENFIQTDAAINPGNSGGALINPYGQLIGINTAIYSQSGGSQGIGFAIPAVLAKDVMQQILERGHVVRGWLGINVQELTNELARSLNVAENSGVVVAGVLKNGPAHNAGIKPGDVITKIAEDSVTTPHQLVDAVAKKSPGSEIKITLVQDGKTRTLTAKVGERPPPGPR